MNYVFGGLVAFCLIAWNIHRQIEQLQDFLEDQDERGDW